MGTANNIGVSSGTPPVSTGTPLGDVASNVYGDSLKMAEKRDKQVEEGIKKIESEPAPTPPKMTEAPKPENYHTDPMQTFGSGAMFLATFGSLLTKQPLTHALNSGAAVMEAKNKGDADAFKQAMDKWKVDTDNAWKVANWQQEVYKAALDKDEFELKARAASFKDEVMLHMADAKMAQQAIKDRDKNLQNFQKYGVLQETYNTAYDEAVANGADEKSAREQALVGYGQAQNMMKGKVDYSKDMEKIDWKNGNPETIVPGTGMTLAAIKQTGEGIAGPNGSGNFQKANLGYGWNPAKMAVHNYIAAVHPDFNFSDASLNYKRLEHEASSLGGQEGKLTLASNMLESSLPSMLEAAKKVGLSSSTSFNALLNSARRQFSDKDFQNFETQLRAVASDYAQFIGRGRQTVHSDEEALKILSANKGVNSIQGFIDAVNIERKNVSNAMNKSNQDVGGKPPSGDQSASATKTIDGKTYRQDENGDWYEQ